MGKPWKEKYLIVDWQKLKMLWVVEMEVGESVTYFLTASCLISSRMCMCFIHLLLATKLCQPAHSYGLCWYSSAFGIFPKVNWMSGSQMSGSILCWGTRKTKVNSPDTLNLWVQSVFFKVVWVCVPASEAGLGWRWDSVTIPGILPLDRNGIRITTSKGAPVVEPTWITKPCLRDFM